LIKRKRQPNFNAEKVEMLVCGIERQSRLLFGKFSGVVSSAAKEKGWEEVAYYLISIKSAARLAVTPAY